MPPIYRLCARLRLSGCDESSWKWPKNAFPLGCGRFDCTEPQIERDKTSFDPTFIRSRPDGWQTTRDLWRLLDTQITTYSSADQEDA
uniref:Uncharacterized protein n=1 Tax=Panagrellus redivivus TaxID=6233 RepID=A0A7E4ZYC7_PANRE